MDRTYPFTAWRLMPSFEPVQIEIVRQYSDLHPEWLYDANGRIYIDSTLFSTKDEAVADGRSRVEAMVKKYHSLGQSIEKRSRALDAASLG